MLTNPGRLSSRDLLLIQHPVTRDTGRSNSLSAFTESFDLQGELKDFLRLTETAHRDLSEGYSGVIALIRPRAISKSSSDNLRLEYLPVGTDDRTEWRHTALLAELTDFLSSRLDSLNEAANPKTRLQRANILAIYGDFTLVIWQRDYSADALAARLSLWREEYRFLKQADFVAGIAAFPEINTDLLDLLTLADEALTEAHSTQRITCVGLDQLHLTTPDQNQRQPVILIVDDNQDQVDYLDFVVRQKGYQTLQANSGEQALELASRCQPDLLLLDVGLPQLDGFDVLQRLRDLSGGKLSLPVIMITGSDTEESVLRGFELGARDYLVKPFDHHDLLSRIQNVFSAGNNNLATASKTFR